MSMGVSCAIASNVVFTTSCRETSQAQAFALPPAVEISEATSCAAFSSISSTRTHAPLLANRSATARPIPLPAPVTTASLPSSRNECEFAFREYLRSPIQSVLLDLFPIGALDCSQSVLRVGVFGRELQGGAQLLLGFTDVPRPSVEQSQILVQMSALWTSAAELDGLVHLFKRLRPVLCVRCFQREVSQFRDSIGDLLVLLQHLEAILVPLRIGIMNLV